MVNAGSTTGFEWTRLHSNPFSSTIGFRELTQNHPNPPLSTFNPKVAGSIPARPAHLQGFCATAPSVSRGGCTDCGFRCSVCSPFCSVFVRRRGFPFPAIVRPARPLASLIALEVQANLLSNDVGAAPEPPHVR